jgi:hypothetical protein
MQNRRMERTSCFKWTECGLSGQSPEAIEGREDKQHDADCESQAGKVPAPDNVVYGDLLLIEILCDTLRLGPGFFG